MGPIWNRGVEGEGTEVQFQLVLGHEGVGDVGPVGALGVGAEYSVVVGGVLDEVFQKLALIDLGADRLAVGEFHVGPETFLGCVLRLDHDSAGGTAAGRALDGAFLL